MGAAEVVERGRVAGGGGQRSAVSGAGACQVPAGGEEGPQRQVRVGVARGGGGALAQQALGLGQAPAPQRELGQVPAGERAHCSVARRELESAAVAALGLLVALGLELGVAEQGPDLRVARRRLGRGAQRGQGSAHVAGPQAHGSGGPIARRLAAARHGDQRRHGQYQTPENAHARVDCCTLRAAWRGRCRSPAGRR